MELLDVGVTLNCRRASDVVARRFDAGAPEIRLGRLLGEEEPRRFRRQLGVTEALAKAAETA